MTSTDPAYREYVRQVLEFAEQGYQAAEEGYYEQAIEVWTSILNDEQSRSCFDEETQAEMAFNLAAAYYITRQDEAFNEVASNWGLSDADKEQIYGSVEEEAHEG